VLVTVVLLVALELLRVVLLPEALVTVVLLVALELLRVVLLDDVLVRVVLLVALELLRVVLLVQVVLVLVAQKSSDSFWPMISRFWHSQHPKQACDSSLHSHSSPGSTMPLPHTASNFEKAEQVLTTPSIAVQISFLRAPLLTSPLN
jgi:hypothetical protein